MRQTILHVSLLVRDYDEAIEFFTEKLDFTLAEDTLIPAQEKRWVLVRPPGGPGTEVLLARPSNPAQEAYVGNQTGGRVSFFLGTDDFWRDFEKMSSRGIRFVREPRVEPYGIVAVFEDLYGNLWDLLERTSE